MKQSMWYALQTVSGEEDKVVKIVKSIAPEGLLDDIYYLRYENVWRKQGKSNVSVELMFKGYVFIKTEDIEKLYYSLKKSPKLVTLLSDKNRDDEITFLALSKEEENFIDELIHGDEERIMRLSYVHRNAQNRIDFAEGPLEKFVDKIYSVDYRHRRVFVNIELLGELRSVKFGIKTDDDITEDSRIDKWNRRLKMMKNIQTDVKENDKDKTQEDIMYGDIKPGVMVYDLTGVYGDKPLVVKKVNREKKKVTVEAEMFSMKVDVELSLGDVVAF